MAGTDYGIRAARPGDLGATTAMQVRSLRVLGAAAYPAPAIEAFLRRVGTMDPAVIAEGAFWVATAPDGRIVGSGGLSRRAPGEAARDPAAAGPAMIGPATVRSVFVAPDWAGRGIGRALVRRAEAAAAAGRARRVRVTASLAAADFYAALGYRARGRRVLDLGDGLVFEGVEMERDLAAPAAALRAA